MTSHNVFIGVCVSLYLIGPALGYFVQRMKNK